MYYGNADVIFISNFCQSNKFNKELSFKLGVETKQGCLIFSSKDISNPRLKNIKVTTVDQSWCNSSKLYVACAI